MPMVTCLNAQNARTQVPREPNAAMLSCCHAQPGQDLSAPKPDAKVFVRYLSPKKGKKKVIMYSPRSLLYWGPAGIKPRSPVCETFVRFLDLGQVVYLLLSYVPLLHGGRLELDAI